LARFEQGVLVLTNALGHGKLTVGATALGLPALPDTDRIRRVIIRTVNQPVNLRDDGTDPTGSTGLYLAAGDTIVHDGSRPDLIKLIRAADATADADVRVAFYGT
jgi:hypothetical protein